MSFGIAGEPERFDTLEELMAHSWNKKSLGEKTWCQIRRRYYWWFRNPIRDAHCNVKWAWQRVFRGWDDRAGWDAGHHMSKTFGEVMLKMSETAHGFPDEHPSVHAVVLPGEGEDSPEFAQWKADLKKHGDALLAYSKSDSLGDDWDTAFEAARESMHWVADNLGSLWD